MIKKLFLSMFFIFLAGCTATLPVIPSDSEVTLKQRGVDKEQFTNTPCHKFMTSPQQVLNYFQNAQSVSKSTWNKATQFGCFIRGQIGTQAGMCNFELWDGGKGRLQCPDTSMLYLVNEQ